MKKKDIWKEEINMLQLSLLFFEFDMVKCKLYQEYIYRCLKKKIRDQCLYYMFIIKIMNIRFYIYFICCIGEILIQQLILNSCCERKIIF